MKDLLGGRKYLYLPRLLTCDQLLTIRSFYVSGHDQIRGHTLLAWWACSLPEQSCHRLIVPRACTNQQLGAMQRLERKGLSRPTPFSASNHHLTCSLREIRTGFSRFLSVELFNSPHQHPRSNSA